MPWTASRIIELDPCATQSLLPNNLACDGDGRFAFIHGSKVQCTRRVAGTSGRSDFTLAYSEKVDVTSVYWWRGVGKYGRPLLVITTESAEGHPPTVQIWNAWRGTGSRIFRSVLPASRCDIMARTNTMRRHGPNNDGSACGRESEASSMYMSGHSSPPRFARGISQASSSRSGQVLFCGASNGAVYGILYREGRRSGFELACTIHMLSRPISSLGSDKEESDLLAAADEGGNLLVWSVEEDDSDDEVEVMCSSRQQPMENQKDKNSKKDQKNFYRWDVVYSYRCDGDFVSSVEVRRNVVIAGHASGLVSFHDVERGVLLASAVTNTKTVTCLDVYPNRDLVLVCGEDCRVTVLGFPSTVPERPVVHFSVALSSIITGCALTTTKYGLPGAALLLWDQSKIVRFEYSRPMERQDTKSRLRGSRVSFSEAARSSPGPTSEESDVEYADITDSLAQEFPRRSSQRSLDSWSGINRIRSNLSDSAGSKDSNDHEHLVPP